MLDSIVSQKLHTRCDLNATPHHKGILVLFSSISFVLTLVFAQITVQTCVSTEKGLLIDFKIYSALTKYSFLPVFQKQVDFFVIVSNPLQIDNVLIPFNPGHSFGFVDQIFFSFSIGSFLDGDFHFGEISDV